MIVYIVIVDILRLKDKSTIRRGDCTSHDFMLGCLHSQKSSMYHICLNTYAPKATETPAAEAADKISLFFASFRPYLGNR